MALFQKKVLDNEVKAFKEAKKDILEERWQTFQQNFLDPNKQANIQAAKEEQYQEGFLRELFCECLGYTIAPNADYNLISELKNVKGSKKADGAIIFEGEVRAVIELKGSDTTDLNKVEPQAFGYKNNQKNCPYVIISNFEKLRFYIDNAIEFIEFNLFTLSEEDFALLNLCISLDSLSKNLPKAIKTSSLSEEDLITKQLYKDYSSFKRELFANLCELNPQYDKLLLFKKTQKLLDRLLFIFFAEDKFLLPPNSIRKILEQWDKLNELDAYTPLYERFKKYFGYMNMGFKGKEYEVFAYNGGLFKPDDVLDNISIDDQILYKYTKQISEYDFDSDIDVNILGHIFENSLSEIEEVQQAIENGQLKIDNYSKDDEQEEKGDIKVHSQLSTINSQLSKRKKDGVFYTPKYITKYIVEQTIGKLCEAKKAELEIKEEDYCEERRRQKKTSDNLLQKLKDYREWLLELTICDPACGSGAFLNEALNFLIAEHKLLDELEAKLVDSALIFSNIECSILENNLFGVDINEESVEIAKLSLWLRTAQPNRKLNNLNNNIKCGNSLYAFDWEQEFPQVFGEKTPDNAENTKCESISTPAGKRGFDVIIGNPPYVQLQKLKNQSETLSKEGYQSFEKTGDLYCLFYERGNELLKEGGLLGFITSNKWMRANYGKKLRAYLLEHSQPQLLIDLGSGIFESATVDSNILIIKKDSSKSRGGEFTAYDLSKETEFYDFTLYQDKAITVEFSDDEIWTIENPIEKSIKQKIESKGIALKDWDIQINYGIKTGFNEAFIIDTLTKEIILSKCLTEEERVRTAKVIKPILRGRDIGRYSINFADLWLINFHNGYKSQFPSAGGVDCEQSEQDGVVLDKGNTTPRLKAYPSNGGELEVLDKEMIIKPLAIEDYPAIKEHLDKYWNKLEKRSDKGDTPYNLRNCAYIDDFDKPKIIFQEMVQESQFVLDKAGIYCNDTCRIITGDGLEFLLSILNTKFFFFAIKNFYGGGGLGEKGVRMKHTFFANFSIPKLKEEEQAPFIALAEKMLYLNRDLQVLVQRGQGFLMREFGVDKLSKKLELWQELSLEDFIKEVGKLKKKLSLCDKADWEEYYLVQQEKVQPLLRAIEETDKAINRMVYELYGLSEEEIRLVEALPN